MPRDNAGDISPRFMSSVDGSLVAFVSAIVAAARNGQENELMLMPGHRDRIVHVATTPEEGGLNLQMSAETIEGMSGRGRNAAELLVSRFHAQGAAQQAGFTLGWPNHRWIRFRSTAAALERFLADFRGAWTAPAGHGPGFELLRQHWAPNDPRNSATLPAGHRMTPSYAWTNAETAEAAGRGVDEALRLAAAVRAEAEKLAGDRPLAEVSVFDGLLGEDGRPRRGAPRPKIGLKMRPLGGDPHALSTYRL